MLVWFSCFCSELWLCVIVCNEESGVLQNKRGFFFFGGGVDSHTWAYWHTDTVGLNLVCSYIVNLNLTDYKLWETQKLYVYVSDTDTVLHLHAHNTHAHRH